MKTAYKSIITIVLVSLLVLFGLASIAMAVTIYPTFIPTFIKSVNYGGWSFGRPDFATAREEGWLSYISSQGSEIILPGSYSPVYVGQYSYVYWVGTFYEIGYIGYEAFAHYNLGSEYDLTKYDAELLISYERVYEPPSQIHLIRLPINLIVEGIGTVSIGEIAGLAKIPIQVTSGEMNIKMTIDTFKKVNPVSSPDTRYDELVILSTAIELYPKENQPPIASFTYSPETTPVVGQSITFDASFSSDPDGDPIIYKWDFDASDGISIDSTELSPKHSYLASGTYVVTLIVNDGKVDSIATVTITVTEENQPPVASFKSWNIEDIGTDQPTRIEGHHMVGGQIEFDARESSDTAGGTLTYYWDFGDGTQETTLNPVILKVYTKPEKFTVTLSVKNDKGISSTNTASEELDLSLNPGDLLVIRSGWPYAQIFDFFGLTYTHVGMYVGKIDGEYRVVESTFSPPPLSHKIGVQETPIERWGYPHETYVDVVRVTNDAEIATRAVAFARGMALADPPHGYDTWLSGKQIDCSGKDDINIPKGYSPLCFSYYCSELVWAAYYRASDGAIDLSDHAKRPLQVAVSPDDIFNHPLSTNVGWHHEKYPPKNVGVLSISVLSPVDISVTDPSGLTITKESSQIPDAAYVETDLDEDNDIDDVVIIPEPKLGDYLILVIPEPDALPEDTYSLEVASNGKTIILAENVPISEIPDQPYLIQSTETGINVASVAKTGGPYVSNEGSSITFDGSASSYPGGDPLQYRWDFDNDGVWDTDWSATATANYTWADDYTGTAKLEVSDGKLTAADTASVTVNNVSPIAEAGADQGVFAGDTAQFTGSFTDPGWLDTHTAIWNFGDSNSATGIVTEENISPDATGQVTGSHAYYQKGTYTVTLTVTDDDGGVGTDTLQVTVKPIPATIRIEPEDLNLASKGEFTAFIQLPTGYDVANIDLIAVVCEGAPTVKGMVSEEDSGTYIAKFNRQDLVNVPIGDAVTLKVIGKVHYNDGLIDFEGSDTIKVINQGKGKPSPALLTFSLGQNFKNPFNPDTWIPYTLAKDVDVVIRIYSLSGKLVRTLNLGHQPAGRYTTKSKAAYWDGKNEAGERVASGVYFYQLQAGKFTATKKMFIAK